MKYIFLVLSILIAELAGVVGSIFTTPNIADWYSGLDKPVFNPPAWVFGPVWTILFALMGIAVFLIWQKRDKKMAWHGLAWYTIQLLLNIMWSVIFFGLHSPGYAFMEILFLLAAIIYTTVLFFRVSRSAGYLMLPYIAWVLFASFLNLTIWQLN